MTSDRPVSAALVEIAEVDPAHPHAQYCLGQYFAELDRRMGTGFDPARSRVPNAEEMRPPGGVFLVATLRGEPVGCGGLKFDSQAPTELKRMWVSPAVRGLGVGRRLLAELERAALAHPNHVIRLDTNGVLSEAISLYRSSGYRDVAPWNDEHYADHWFEKDLDEASGAGGADGGGGSPASS